MVFKVIVGKPGSGKTELFAQFCAHAIAHRLRVLILCPTGQLLATYRQRLPDSDLIRIETIHAGIAIYREKEALVEHAPPSTLRKYDAILVDECSQIDLCHRRASAEALRRHSRGLSTTPASRRRRLYDSWLQKAADYNFEHHLSHRRS